MCHLHSQVVRGRTAWHPRSCRRASLLASLSLPIDALPSEAPANRPFDCEYDSMSISGSLNPAAFAPEGPATADASAPSFSLPERTLSAPLSVINRST